MMPEQLASPSPQRERGTLPLSLTHAAGSERRRQPLSPPPGGPTVSEQRPANGASRRDFLKTATATGAAAMAANLTLLSNVHAQGNNDLLRVGLIGCGGRGTGAAGQCVRGGNNVKLWAMGDAFEDRLNSCRNNLMNNRALAGRIDVPRERCFVGLDAYRQVIANCDIVCLATPPGFRPQHIQATIAARKHLFTEKPVAVDGPGVRT